MGDFIQVGSGSWFDPDDVLYISSKRTDPNPMYKTFASLEVTIKFKNSDSDTKLYWSWSKAEPYTDEQLQEIIAHTFAELFDCRGDLFGTTQPKHTKLGTL